MTRKLLIASSNPGKVSEMKLFFATMPYVEVVSLQDIGLDIESPEETGETMLDNAILKANYYAKASGELTLADDTGLCIEALDGWPGVRSARVASTTEERIQEVLKRMNGVDNRKAYFEASIAIIDPLSQNVFVSSGRTDGSITHEPSKNTEGFGYDPIFEVEGMGKTYADISVEEKNTISHRAKSLSKARYYIKNSFGSKHLVVPCSLVLEGRKVLMILRNDPQRPEYHRKWEFPGGTVETSEQCESNVVRETKEETGLDVQVEKLMQHIAVETTKRPTFQYQVFLIPYICSVTGGALDNSNEEAIELKWFDIDEVLDHDLVGENARLYKKLLPELHAYIEANTK